MQQRSCHCSRETPETRHAAAMQRATSEQPGALSRMGTTAESYTRDWVRQKMLLGESGTDVI